MSGTNKNLGLSNLNNLLLINDKLINMEKGPGSTTHINQAPNLTKVNPTMHPRYILLLNTNPI